MKQVSIIFFAFIILSLSSCLADNLEQETLDANKSFWQGQNISDYVYTSSVLCFCIPEDDIMVTVTGNVVSSASYTPGGVEITGTPLSEVRTIDDFFDLVQDALDDNVFFISVQYHQTYGFPELVEIDPNGGVADDEVVYTIRDFTF